MAGPHRPALAAITGSHRAIRRHGGRLSAAMTSDHSAAAAWDAEYQAGRYAGEPPCGSPGTSSPPPARPG